MVKRFISFEGGEGSGKTTLIEMLTNELNQLGYKIVKTREPGGSKIAEEIRNVILNIDNVDMDYMTEALLLAASRRQHLAEVIIPALNDEKIVICDRYVDSSLAYQGYARGLGIKEVYEINKYATEGILPELTIYIDVDPNIGLSRIKNNRREVDRLDLEKISFHQKVREGYLEIAEMFSDRIKIVDGNRTAEEIYKDIKKEVLNIL
ncbi:MAG: dTMP kinase [Bacilli bacterium]|nr:dTMP kinase [Bacilli bacterium]